MPRLRDSMTDSRSISAWSGSVADLQIVLQTMEEQYRDQREKVVADLTSWERSSRDQDAATLAKTQAAKAKEDPEDRFSQHDLYARWEVGETRALEASQGRLDAAEARAEKFDQISVFVKARKGAARTTSGRPTDVVEYLAPLDVRDVTLRTPAGALSGYGITVSMDRNDGVELTVTSEDSRWASLALAEMYEALKRRRSRWGFLRSPVFLFIFFFVCLAVFFGFLLGSEGLAKLKDFTLFNLALCLGWAAAGAAWIARRVLPAFELTPQSGKSRIDRLLYVLGSGVATVGLGIFVNAIS